MSTDNVNGKSKANQDINWDVLIEHSESEIKVLERRINDLRKSSSFFKKQASNGVPFPTPDHNRHKKIS